MVVDRETRIDKLKEAIECMGIDDFFTSEMVNPNPEEPLIIGGQKIMTGGIIYVGFLPKEEFGY